MLTFPKKSIAFLFLIISLIFGTIVKNLKSQKKTLDYTSFNVLFPERFSKDGSKYSVKVYEELNESTKNIPKEINELVASYVWVPPLEELRDSLLERLGVLENDRKNLNFLNPNFGSCLYHALAQNQNKIDISEKSFIFDLSRVVFRWLVHLKQQIGSKFQVPEVSVAIENLTLFIQETEISFPSNLEFENMHDNAFEHFQKLLDYEFERGNSQLLFKFMISINDFYDIETGFDCSVLKLFLGENFNRDFLLRYALIFKDPIGIIRTQCFSDSEEVLKLQQHDQSTVDESEDFEISLWDEKNNSLKNLSIK